MHDEEISREPETVVCTLKSVPRDYRYYSEVTIAVTFGPKNATYEFVYRRTGYPDVKILVGPREWYYNQGYIHPAMNEANAFLLHRFGATLRRLRAHPPRKQSSKPRPSPSPYGWPQMKYKTFVDCVDGTLLLRYHENSFRGHHGQHYALTWFLQCDKIEGPAFDPHYTLAPYMPYPMVCTVQELRVFGREVHELAIRVLDEYFSEDYDAPDDAESTDDHLRESD